MTAYVKSRNLKSPKQEKQPEKSLDQEMNDLAYKYFPVTKYKLINKMTSFLRKCFLFGVELGKKRYIKQQLKSKKK